MFSGSFPVFFKPKASGRNDPKNDDAGCDHFATTRMDQLNYASQAAAAGDLGGIEAVRKRKLGARIRGGKSLSIMN